MEAEAYDKTDALENRYWWYLGRRYVFDKILGRYFAAGQDKKIADIGCGTGGNLKVLQKYGDALGLDIEPRALEYCRSKGLSNVALMKGRHETGLESESLDLVTMLDVLEHFEDDAKALGEVNRVLRPGGFALINVPAFGFLWSELDVELHHFRRYTRAELNKKLEKAGFEIIKSSYIFFFVFPLIFVYRTVGKFQEKRFHPQFSYVEFPKIINAFFVALSKIEAVLLKFISFPFGSSALVLAKKNNLETTNPQKVSNFCGFYFLG